MTNEIFLKGIAMIVSCYHIQPEETALKIFEMLLTDLQDKDYMEAVINLCRDSPRLPGDNIAAVIRNQVERQNGISSEEAWGQVKKAIERIGSWGEPKFSTPAIRSAVDALGWKTICLTEDSQMGTMRAHFFKIYDAYKRRDTIRETRVQIMGSSIKTLKTGMNIE